MRDVTPILMGDPGSSPRHAATLDGQKARRIEPYHMYVKTKAPEVLELGQTAYGLTKAKKDALCQRLRRRSHKAKVVCTEYELFNVTRVR